MTTAKRPNRILIAQIVNAHGIRGEVRVRSFASDPAALAAYGPLSNAAGDRRFELKNVRAADKGVIARIRGIDDRTAAETLKGTDLYIDRALLPVPAAEEFYHTDLIGLEARTLEGDVTGRIVNVQNFGGGDLLEVRGEGASEFVPFEKAWVPEVDIEGGFVVVNRPSYVEGEGEE